MNTNYKKITTKVQKSVGKLIAKYNLINDGEKVVVGLSGGKDSYVLLHTLANRRRYLPIDFEIYAVHINVNNLEYKIDSAFYEKMCKDLNVKFIVKNIDIDFNHKKNVPQCMPCALKRRNALFDFCLEIGCNKLALGHHMDDAVETLLMNMTFQGAINSLPYSLSMFNETLFLIRPLLELSDSIINEYSKIINYKPLLKNCPNEKKTKRDDIRKIIDQLEELFPHARSSIFNSMSNIHKEYLPKK